MTRNRYDLLGCNMIVAPKKNDYQLQVGYNSERTMELARFLLTDFTIKDGLLFNTSDKVYFMLKPELHGCGYVSLLLIRLIPYRIDIESKPKISLERVRVGFKLALKEGRKIIDEQLDYFQDRDCLKCN